MSEQMCNAQHVVTGVTVTCHRTRLHKGPHSSSTFGTRWRDGGEVLPPVAPPACVSRSVTPMAATSGRTTLAHTGSRTLCCD